VLIFGLILFIGSLLVVMGLYAWAARERPVRYVPPSYLLLGGIGAAVGVLLIAASQS
jgi:hypothetical protein